jgi:plastocyanin
MKTPIAVRILAAGSSALLAASCGGTSTSGTTTLPPGYYVTISGMSFSPLNLDVPPGATVTVVNRDPMGHSVTSEATPGAFVAGGVAGVTFDTGIFTGTRTFALPAAAPEGTVVPYFCQSHMGTMVTPNGTLTIHAGAMPGPGPVLGGGGGGGYGY